MRLPQLNQWRQRSCTTPTGTEFHHCGEISLSCPRNPRGREFQLLEMSELSPAVNPWTPQRDFSCSFHPPWPASLCGCERSGLVRGERWRRVGRPSGPSSTSFNILFWGPWRDYKVLAFTLLIPPTYLFILRPHFGRQRRRKRLWQAASTGCVSGHASLPAHGHWLEGKSRSPV